MVPFAGQTISHYRIVDQIGGGGMGVIYRAVDLKLDRTVALKFLPPELTRDPDAKQRFIFEAKASSALQHGNVCVVHDIDETPDGQMFICMEFLEGQTIRKKLERGPLPIDQSVEIAFQAAQGLAHAHKQGIIHRDIKPANLIVTDEGVVKVLDFGVAKLKGQTLNTGLGSTVGTVAYMSPEQAQGTGVDQRTDIWSLGAVLFEMLTGQVPFRGEHDSAMIYSILNEEAPPVRRLRPDAPEPLATLVSAMLQKDPDARIPTMQAVVEQLSALMPRSGQAAPRTQLLRQLRRPIFIIPILLVLVAIGIRVSQWVENNKKVAWARDKALDEIGVLGKEEQWAGAFRLVSRADEIIPDDPVLQRLMEWTVRRVSISSNPAGARVFWREYADTSEHWQQLGETPVANILFPRGRALLKLEKQGFDSLVSLVSEYDPPSMHYSLDPAGSVPPAMVHVPGGEYPLAIPGLEQIEQTTLADYLIDRFEVTNRQYKEFMDAGGYQKRDFWTNPFRKHTKGQKATKNAGDELSFDEAMALFHDQTGRPGPATWEVGTYPEGQADFPVSGISWFEAAAYARWAGKELPTVFHWSVAAGTEFGSDIVPQSNFSGKGTAAVGAYKGINRFGAYDMAGNVREWCWNETEGRRFILGGGWNDQPYLFTDAFAQDPFDRGVTNGFRCIRYLGTEPNRSKLEAAITLPGRDLVKERPVPDEVFRYYRSLYAYDRVPLAPAIESTDSSNGEWIVQRVTFTAAYGTERMSAFLFLPRRRPGMTPASGQSTDRSAAPFQVVVFFPGSEALFSRTANPAGMTKDFDFILRDGRAVVYPVYKSTFERGDGLTSDVPTETSTYRDHVIMWVKDFSRTVDYLETRKDLDASALAYYGVSWGGAMGAIVPALEPRIKVVVLHVAGLSLQKTRPEVDAINYVSRVHQPLLLLSGQYDHFFPVETSMKPMFSLLGTPAADKQNYIYPTGHAVPRTKLIAETLSWLDKYLGPAR